MLPLKDRIEVFFFQAVGIDCIAKKIFYHFSAPRLGRWYSHRGRGDALEAGLEQPRSQRPLSSPIGDQGGKGEGEHEKSRTRGTGDRDERGCGRSTILRSSPSHTPHAARGFEARASHSNFLSHFDRCSL